jgi:hypothetical protein
MATTTQALDTILGGRQRPVGDHRFDNLQPLAGTEIGKAAGRAMAKIRSSIDEQAWQYLRRMAAPSTPTSRRSVP